jgi:hypothetical protein
MLDIKKKNIGRGVFVLGTMAVSLFLLSGCIPSHNRCFKGAASRGYYCYKNYNFGQNLSSNYKKGIRDGCKTGEGHFVRDYSLSSASADYKVGWDVGRAHCKLITPEDAKPGMRTQYQQDIDQKKQP